jgi:hypothetical protein
MRIAALSTLALLLATSSASAQTPVPSFQLERLELDNSAKGSLTLASGLAMRQRQYRVFGALHYQHRPLLLLVDGVDTAAIITGRFTVHLGGAYAIIDGLEVGLQIPIVVYQGGDDVSAHGITPPDAFGFGAPVLSARWAFLRKAAGMPFDMAVDLAVPIPIGSNTALANDPGFGLIPRVSAGFDVSMLRISAELGVKIRPYTVMGTRALGSEFTWGLGAALNVTDNLRLEAALKSYISFANVPAGFELLGGARLTVGALELFLLGGMALGLAALNVHFKEVKDIVANLLALLFYLTPVIYTLEGVHFPEQGWARGLGGAVTTFVRWFNPFTPFTEATQDLLFRGAWPAATLWLHMGLWAAGSWIVGMWVFDRLRDSLVEAV